MRKCGVCGEDSHYGRCDRNLMRLLKEVRAETAALLEELARAKEAKVEVARFNRKEYMREYMRDYMRKRREKIHE